MSIETLIVGILPSPSVIVLRPIEDPASDEAPVRALPIWIGPHEAASIGVVMNSMPRSRPMTHDLCVDVIAALGAQVESVEINDVQQSTFYARINMSRQDRRFALDSRPSDAIAIAVRENAPIYVAEEVLEVASYPYLSAGDLDPEKEIAQFHAFIENVSPEDFLADAAQNADEREETAPSA